jgi:hypothetical protein
MDGGKFRRKLSEVNTRAVSRGQNKLVGKFNMAAVIWLVFGEQVVEYTYIPAAIKRELVPVTIHTRTQQRAHLEIQDS